MISDFYIKTTFKNLTFIQVNACRPGTLACVKVKFTYFYFILSVLFTFSYSRQLPELKLIWSNNLSPKVSTNMSRPWVESYTDIVCVTRFVVTRVCILVSPNSSMSFFKCMPVLSFISYILSTKPCCT